MSSGLQEGLRQGLACSLVGNHEEVQHQHQPYPSHQKPLSQGQWSSKSVLNCSQTDTEDDYPILRIEVETAVQSLKKGKSAGVENIPAELVQAGGEDVITDLTTTCNEIWQTGEWPITWTQSLVITLPKKGNPNSARTTG